MIDNYTADLKTLVFIPVYNQVRQFPLVLEEINALDASGVQFLLVNNGSSDGSEVLVHESGHDFLEIPTNLGVGYSYMLALDWALERDYQIFGTMASNGKMIAQEIPRLLEPICNDLVDYVSGSRFLDGGAYPNLPRFRRVTIPAVNWVAYATTGRRLTDATNGFRAFRLSWMERARFDWHASWMWTYEFEYYIYAKFLRDPRSACIEVPSTMRYPEIGPYTKIRPGVDWWSMIKPWIRAAADPGFD